jgi:hypothetical protein
MVNRGDDNTVYFSRCFPDGWEKSHDRNSKDMSVQGERVPYLGPQEVQ